MSDCKLSLIFEDILKFHLLINSQWSHLQYYKFQDCILIQLLDACKEP